MKKSMRILSLLLALAMLLTVATACGKEDGKKTSDKANISGDDTVSGNATDYTVSLKTAGGMPMSGIDVYVYADSSLGDMKSFGQTNEKGIATFNI